jgi:membrane protein involved in colicin uptake
MATETTTSEETEDPSTKDPDTGAGGKGPEGAGDEELTAENAAKWREMARKHERQNGKLQAELDRIKAESMTETEKAIEKAKAEAREEARAEMLAEMVGLAVETAAGEKLADPSFARLLTEDDREGFVTDGKVDRKAIAAALDNLVKRYPNLAKSAKAGSLPGGGRKPASGFSMNDEIRRLAGRRS